MTTTIQTDDGQGDPRIAKVEKLAVDGVRVLNRITWKDGKVTITRQGGEGPYNRTQAEWDAIVAQA